MRALARFVFSPLTSSFTSLQTVEMGKGHGEGGTELMAANRKVRMGNLDARGAK